MATIETRINLVDGMSPALRSMNKALNVLLNTFEAVAAKTKTPIDVNAVRLARNELAQVSVALESLGAKAAQSQSKVTNATRKAAGESTKLVDNTRRVKPVIDQNSKAQQRFNGYIRSGINESHRFLSSIRNLLGVYAGAQGLGSVIKTADTLVTTKARLNLINDGLRTTEQFQQQIYESAMNARSGYAQTADMVAKLATRAGQVFSSNDETVAFANTLQKMFHIAGASTQEMYSASLQLTQALGSGVLRGEELNAVFEAAPNVIQAIADYMNKPIGKIRELAKKGEITAGIVKAAMFNAADDVNKKFASLPMTWAQVWTIFKNFALKSFEPLMERISSITSSDTFKSFAGGVAKVVSNVAKAVIWIYDKVAAVAKYIYSNWNKLKPAVLGVVNAIIAFRTVLFITKGIMAAYNMLTAVMIARKKLAAGATFAQTVQQTSLNAAMLACPLTWLIGGIVTLIAVIGTVTACTYDWENSNIDFKKTIFNVMNAIRNITAKTVEFLKKTWLNVWGKIKQLALEVWDVFKAIGNFVVNNWSFIAPIIWSIVGAFAAYKLALLAIAVWHGICTVAVAVWTAVVAVAKFVMSLFTLATWAQVAANIKMAITGWAASSPLLFWIVVIAAIIAIFYLLIAAINRWCGTSISATGLICALFTGLAVHIFNIFSYAWNIVASFVEFFVNVWTEPMYSVKALFVNLATNVIDCFIAMTKGCDQFATNFANAIITAINKVLDGWNWLVDKLGVVGKKIGLGKAGKFEARTSITSDFESVKSSLQSWLGEKPEGYRENLKLKKYGTQDIFDAYNFGAGLGDKLASGTQDLFGKGKDKLSGLFDDLSGKGSELLGNLENLIATKDPSQIGATDQDPAGDLAKALGGGFDNPALDKIAGDTGKIAKNTGDTSEEDYSYLRNLARREAIQRYTLTDLHVNMTNNNTISNGMDLNKVIAEIAKQIATAVKNNAEGAGLIYR